METAAVKRKEEGESSISRCHKGVPIISYSYIHVRAHALERKRPHCCWERHLQSCEHIYNHDRQNSAESRKAELSNDYIYWSRNEIVFELREFYRYCQEWEEGSDKERGGVK